MWGLTCLLENVGFVLKCFLGCFPAHRDFTSVGRDRERRTLPVEVDLMSRGINVNGQRALL